MIVVDAVSEPAEEVRAAIARLLPQLNSERREPSVESLRRFVETEGHTLFLAGEDDIPVGMLTLVVTRSVEGRVTAWIESVVVDVGSRRIGIGDALVTAAIEASRRQGADRILLRSSVERAVAHRLYARHGLVQRSTRVFGLELEAAR